MATKAIEDKKHEMEATMVNLGDKVSKWQKWILLITNSIVIQGWIKYPAGPHGCRVRGETGGRLRPWGVPNALSLIPGLQMTHCFASRLTYNLLEHPAPGGEEQPVHTTECQDDWQLLKENFPHSLHPVCALLFYQVLTKTYLHNYLKMFINWNYRYHAIEGELSIHYYDYFEFE